MHAAALDGYDDTGGNRAPNGMTPVEYNAIKQRVAATRSLRRGCVSDLPFARSDLFPLEFFTSTADRLLVGTDAFSLAASQQYAFAGKPAVSATMHFTPIGRIQRPQTFDGTSP